MANRNHYTAKLSERSDQELKDILDSKHHVDDAKVAAQWILDERGLQTDYQSPKTEVTKLGPWTSRRNQTPERRRHYAWKMLAFGVALIVGAFYINFDNLITTQESLIELKGTIRNSDVIIDNVSSTNRMGSEATSRKATLYFGLNEHQKSFILFKNIKQDYSYPEFNRISKFLKNAQTVTVWINQSELESRSPKVFQIDVDGSTILDFASVKDEYTSVFIFLLLIGLVMIGLAFRIYYPARMKKTHKTDE